MPSKGQPVTLYYYAWDTVNLAPKTGDVANHTLRLIKDGGAPTSPANVPAEVDATNTKGWYQVTLSSIEATANTVLLGGISSTAGIVLVGSQVAFENPGPFRINAANSFSVYLVQSTDNKTPYTTAVALVATVSKNGGAPAAIAGTITQVGSTNQYVLAGTAADFNASTLAFSITATGANPVYVNINTIP